MFFVFYLSSSSITIKSDDLFHCSFKEFFEFNCSRLNVNFKCIFIIDDSFSWYACLILIKILKSFSILSFNFFNDHKIIINLCFWNSKILSFILYIISFQCLYQFVSSLWLWLLLMLAWLTLVIISYVWIYSLLCLL